MRARLENKGNCDYTIELNKDNASDVLCKFNLATPLNTVDVTDSNYEDEAILLDMIGRHTLNCHLAFKKMDGVERHPKLNLTLSTALFSEFEDKFRKNFEIRGEIHLFQCLEMQSPRYRGFMIYIQHDCEAIRDGDMYTFQDVSYDTSFRPFRKAKQLIEFEPVKTEIRLIIQTYDVMDSPNNDLRFQIIRKIFNDEIATDVTIVASNDAQIKCHKSFLIAHSSMFERMFKSGMQEATSGVINMKTVSEPGVRALLAYLYYWDLKEASSNCDIAIELFKAADYFIIPRLDMDLRNLFLEKPVEWFSVNGAMDLFVMSHRLGRTQLKSAARQALQLKFDELKTNASYLELLKTDPTIAAEFCNAQSGSKGQGIRRTKRRSNKRAIGRPSRNGQC